MPHLAPLKWFILTIIFWTILLFSMSMTWWQMSPKLTPFSMKSLSINTPKWPWM